MSDAFADVAKMKKIKEDIKNHEGQLVELTLENGRKREKNKVGRLIEVYPSLFIVEYKDDQILYEKQKHEEKANSSSNCCWCNTCCYGWW